MDIPRIPQTPQKRVVIIGGGFAGLKLARNISKKDFQIVLIDKNNYHQFQPLFYQVATAGLEPSSISFPLRKIFQKQPNVHIRVTEVIGVDTTHNYIQTTSGDLTYDHLVIATGADTNFYGNANISASAYPMKSTAEALGLRNRLLQNFEDALVTENMDEVEGLLNVVIVGGGPTGVEVAGTLADLKHFILPKDYPELDFMAMKIFLLQGADKLLNTMSTASSKKSKEYLEKLGVNVQLNAQVKDYDGKYVLLGDGSKIRTNTLVWAAGVTGKRIPGLKEDVFANGNRTKVDPFNKVIGYENIYALGDIAAMISEQYPQGHPQMAQLALQQAVLLAKNFSRLIRKQQLIPFKYKDLGSMATIGRNLAVADLPGFSFQGFFAWVFWMLVHLMSIVGVKNRVFIFINWCWNYITYDQSLRLIIKPKMKK